MNIDEQIAVLEAYRDGIPIEYKGDGHTWRGKTVNEGTDLNFHSYTYRVKPEIPDTLYLSTNNLDINEYHPDFTLTGEPTVEDGEQYALVDKSKVIYLVDVGINDEKLVSFKKYNEARAFESRNVSITSSIKKCLVLDSNFIPKKRKRLKGPEE